MDIRHKKVIIIGECDGVPSESIAQCMQACQAEVVFQTTQYFV